MVSSDVIGVEWTNFGVGFIRYFNTEYLEIATSNVLAFGTSDLGDISIGAGKACLGITVTVNGWEMDDDILCRGYKRVKKNRESRKRKKQSLA